MSPGQVRFYLSLYINFLELFCLSLSLSLLFFSPSSVSWLPNVTVFPFCFISQSPLTSQAHPPLEFSRVSNPTERQKMDWMFLYHIRASSCYTISSITSPPHLPMSERVHENILHFPRCPLSFVCTEISLLPTPIYCHSFLLRKHRPIQPRGSSFSNPIAGQTHSALA